LPAALSPEQADNRSRQRQTGIKKRPQHARIRRQFPGSEDQRASVNLYGHRFSSAAGHCENVHLDLINQLPFCKRVFAVPGALLAAKQPQP
jgi:hypothetical protein